MRCPVLLQEDTALQSAIYMCYSPSMPTGFIELYDSSLYLVHISTFTAFITTSQSTLKIHL